MEAPPSASLRDEPPTHRAYGASDLRSSARGPFASLREVARRQASRGGSSRSDEGAQHPMNRSRIALPDEPRPHAPSCGAFSCARVMRTVMLSSSRPPSFCPDHLRRDGARRVRIRAATTNVWERARSPELRRYCDLVASASSKLAGTAAMAESALASAARGRRGPARVTPRRSCSQGARSGRARQARRGARGARARPGRATRRRSRTRWRCSRGRASLARTGPPGRARPTPTARSCRARRRISAAERASASVEAGLVAMARAAVGLDEAVAALREGLREAQDETQVVAVLALALALDRARRHGRVARAARRAGSRRPAHGRSPRRAAKELLAVAPAEANAIDRRSRSSRPIAAGARDAWERVPRRGVQRARGPRMRGRTSARRSARREDGGRDDAARRPRCRALRRLALAIVARLRASAARALTRRRTRGTSRRTRARGERWALHVRVERMLSPARADDDAVADPRLDAELRLEAARSMLEDGRRRAQPRRAPSVRPGHRLLRARRPRRARADLFQKAIDVLAPAVDAAPDAPATTGGARRARLRVREDEPPARGARDVAPLHPAPRRGRNARRRHDEHGRGRDAPRTGRRRARDVPRGHARVRRRSRTRPASDRPTSWRSGTSPSRSTAAATRAARSTRRRRRRSMIGHRLARDADRRARSSSRTTRPSSSCPSGSGSGTSRCSRAPRRATRRTRARRWQLWTEAEQRLGRVRRAVPRPTGRRTRSCASRACAQAQVAREEARGREARGEAPAPGSAAASARRVRVIALRSSAP